MKTMKGKNGLAVVVAALMICATIFITQTTASPAEYTVYFCPNDRCDEAVINQINGAETSIYVAMYSFTLDSIGDSLIAAKKRGVEIHVVLDNQQAASDYSEYQRLLDAGIDVKLDAGSYYMHNKFAVIDGKTVITGSYNWTDRATNGNDENLIVINSVSLAQQYRADFALIEV